MPETHKMLALSTAHVTNQTAYLLDYSVDGQQPESVPVTYNKGEYGWFVYVPGKGVEMPVNVPTDLEGCLHYARHLGCDWIMFDRDVDLIDELPSYNW